MRSATIAKDGGEVVFEQSDIEVPKAWSQMATNVVVSKYFRGAVGKPTRETSVRQLIGRVVDTITGWGRTDGPETPNADCAVRCHRKCPEPGDQRLFSESC